MTSHMHDSLRSQRVKYDEDASTSFHLSLPKSLFGDKSGSLVSSSLFRWFPPPSSIVKCNVNASFSVSAYLVGGGAVFRDSSGQILPSMVFNPFSASSATLVEAICLRRAVLWALSFSFAHVWFECDSLVIVNAMSGVNPGPMEIHAISFDVQVALRNFSSSSLSHVHRHGNEVAHTLAALSQSHIPKDVALVQIPFNICSLAAKDCLS
ncbi:uncharacterized protein LOC132314529 [Cornus florida]|uniref:uncharacterized protein LOC132314529 n=1 Tax=Cornus florida TaxID=4283 RepID=UPI002898FE01|nr:uncharacterized protein LOC132314529 [Cornus florida]